MSENGSRPTGRQQHVTGQGNDIYKRGEGLNTGPVGEGGRPPKGSSGSQQGSSQQGSQQQGTSGQHRPSGYRPAGGSSGQTTRAGGGKGMLLIVIIAAVILLGGGGAGLGGLFGGGGNNDEGYVPVQTTTASPATKPTTAPTVKPTTTPVTPPVENAGISSAQLENLLGNNSASWDTTSSNVRKLNTSVVSGARKKRTSILGNGKDTVTIMVYMCGADLESQSGIASSDLKEMASASISDKINVIVYTGGAKKWKTSFISNKTNQIYQLKSGGLKTLVDNAGTGAMTKPETLASFIQYCKQNFPADRNELIFWDHGGGSLTGYGYDERNTSAGSMGLSGIDQALTSGGVTFDFIGFDTCLMATLENALMLTKHADYMIASEETEPGVGWYYTNWLNAFSKNTSMATLDIGKAIVDDFVSVCNQRCPGQKTTLSVVDLAELEKTAPEAFKGFASGTTRLMEDGAYKQVSQARSGAREFATSSKIDQVDIVDLANKIGTDESKLLARTLLSAIKYNNTSSSMTNAYGLSVYFPYRKTSKVDSAVKSYKAIGLDNEYSRCIKQFASYETAGQASSGGASNPLMQLLGGADYEPSGSMLGSDAISELLSGLLGGRMANVEGLNKDNSEFLKEGLDVQRTTSFIANNQLDPQLLVWSDGAGEDSGRKLLYLPAEQWDLVNEIALSVYYDDGSGYIDLGLDNVFEFTDSGHLVGAFNGVWPAIDNDPIPYYYIGTAREGSAYTIMGYVPILLNGERAELILVHDNEHPSGYIAGVRRIYENGETETIAKAQDALTPGDVIDYICDYYNYDGTYENSYRYGKQHVYTGNEQVSDVYINAAKAEAVYRLTDIYGQKHWTPVME